MVDVAAVHFKEVAVLPNFGRAAEHCGRLTICAQLVRRVSRALQNQTPHVFESSLVYH